MGRLLSQSLNTYTHTERERDCTDSSNEWSW